MTKNQESIFSNATYGGCGCLLLLMCSGVIGAIALPSFLNQAGKAKQVEPKQYVAVLNKGQQVYYAEKSVFSTSVDALGLGIKTETPTYKYSVRTTKKAAFSYGVSKQPQLNSHVGAVFVVPVKEVKPHAAKDGIITTISIFCQADSPGTIKPAEPTYENGKSLCGKGTTQAIK